MLGLGLPSLLHARRSKGDADCFRTASLPCIPRPRSWAGRARKVDCSPNLSAVCSRQAALPNIWFAPPNAVAIAVRLRGGFFGRAILALEAGVRRQENLSNGSDNCFADCRDYLAQQRRRHVALSRPC